jgi:hypothetical protein
MMTLSMDTIAAIAVPVVLAVVWLVRLEGRVNGLHTLRDGDLRLADSQRDADNRLTAQRMKGIDEKLDDIKEKLDGVDDMRHKIGEIRKALVP